MVFFPVLHVSIFFAYKKLQIVVLGWCLRVPVVTMSFLFTPQFFLKGALKMLANSIFTDELTPWQEDARTMELWVSRLENMEVEMLERIAHRHETSSSMFCSLRKKMDMYRNYLEGEYTDMETKEDHAPDDDMFVYKGETLRTNVWCEVVRVTSLLTEPSSPYRRAAFDDMKCYNTYIEMCYGLAKLQQLCSEPMTSAKK